MVNSFFNVDFVLVNCHIKKLRLPVLFLLMALLFVCIKPANGASIRVEDGRNCEISLTGEIVKGDYSTLKKVAYYQ